MFLDVEKTNDSVLRNIIWNSLEAKGILQTYVKVIRDMYNGAKINIQTPVGSTDTFSVKVKPTPRFGTKPVHFSHHY